MPRGGGTLVDVGDGDVPLFRSTFFLKRVELSLSFFRTCAELSVPFEETCRIMCTIL